MPQSPFACLRDRAALSTLLTLLSCLGALCACSSKENGGASSTSEPVCVDGDDDCGKACGNFLPCPSGLYCSDSQACQKDCTVANTSACSSDSCTSEGRCTDGLGGSGSGGSGSGGSGSGGSSDSGTQFPLDPDATTDPEGCGRTNVIANRVVPNVVLIIDQSLSMDEDFEGAGTRWDVLRSFLLESPGGLIADLQNQISFGVAMYSGLSEEPDAECPVMTTVNPQLNNYQEIATAYQGAEPLDDTPTGDAIDAVIDRLGLDPRPLDGTTNPTVFILATDGEPDRCEELDPQNGHEEAIAAVTRAHGLGVPTYVISVGNDVSASHQQQMANAGLGIAAGDPDAQYWTAGDDASLRTALTDIVGQQLSCDVALQGRVTAGDPCRGTVLLSGNALTCNDPDGWTLLDPQHIRLQGAACESLKSDEAVQLNVSFPCDVQILE